MQLPQCLEIHTGRKTDFSSNCSFSSVYTTTICAKMCFLSRENSPLERDFSKRQQQLMFQFCMCKKAEVQETATWARLDARTGFFLQRANSFFFEEKKHMHVCVPGVSDITLFLTFKGCMGVIGKVPPQTIKGMVCSTHLNMRQLLS